MAVIDLGGVLSNPSFEADLVHGDWDASKPNDNYDLLAPEVNPAIMPVGMATTLVAPVGNHFIGVLNVGDLDRNGKLSHAPVAISVAAGATLSLTVWANRGRLAPSGNTAAPQSRLNVTIMGWAAGDLPVLDPATDDWSRQRALRSLQRFNAWAGPGEWSSQTFEVSASVALEYVSVSLAGINGAHDSFVAWDIQ